MNLYLIEAKQQLLKKIYENTVEISIGLGTYGNWYKALNSCKVWSDVIVRNGLRNNRLLLKAERSEIEISLLKDEYIEKICFKNKIIYKLTPKGFKYIKDNFNQWFERQSGFDLMK